MVGIADRQTGCGAPAGLLTGKGEAMHLSRTLTLKLLKRQEWGKRPAAQPPRRRSALASVRSRRLLSRT
jgi:hypothetical protein